MDIVDFWISNHNNNILIAAMKTINDFLSDKDFELFFFDEEGNVIKPKGKLTHVLYEKK